MIGSWIQQNGLFVVGQTIDVTWSLQETDKAIVSLYNKLAIQNGWAHNNKKYITDVVVGKCTVAGILGESYGKYMKKDQENTIIMEYNTFLETIIQYVPKELADFEVWVKSDPLILQQFADMLMYTLPSPRYKWYKPSNFQVIQD